MNAYDDITGDHLRIKRRKDIVVSSEEILEVKKYLNRCIIKTMRKNKEYFQNIITDIKSGNITISLTPYLDYMQTRKPGELIFYCQIYCLGLRKNWVDSKLSFIQRNHMLPLKGRSGLERLNDVFDSSLENILPKNITTNFQNPHLLNDDSSQDDLLSSSDDDSYYNMNYPPQVQNIFFLKDDALFVSSEDKTQVQPFYKEVLVACNYVSKHTIYDNCNYFEPDRIDANDRDFFCLPSIEKDQYYGKDAVYPYYNFLLVFTFILPYYDQYHNNKEYIDRLDCFLKSTVGTCIQNTSLANQILNIKEYLAKYLSKDVDTYNHQIKIFKDLNTSIKELELKNDLSHIDRIYNQSDMSYTLEHMNSIQTKLVHQDKIKKTWKSIITSFATLFLNGYELISKNKPANYVINTEKQKLVKEYRGINRKEEYRKIFKEPHFNFPTSKNPQLLTEDYDVENIIDGIILVINNLYKIARKERYENRIDDSDNQYLNLMNILLITIESNKYDFLINENKAVHNIELIFDGEGHEVDLLQFPQLQGKNIEQLKRWKESASPRLLNQSLEKAQVELRCIYQDKYDTETLKHNIIGEFKNNKYLKELSNLIRTKSSSICKYYSNLQISDKSFYEFHKNLQQNIPKSIHESLVNALDNAKQPYHSDDFMTNVEYLSVIRDFCILDGTIINYNNFTVKPDIPKYRFITYYNSALEKAIIPLGYKIYHKAFSFNCIECSKLWYDIENMLRISILYYYFYCYVFEYYDLMATLSELEEKFPFLSFSDNLHDLAGKQNNTLYKNFRGYFEVGNYKEAFHILNVWWTRIAVEQYKLPYLLSKKEKLGEVTETSMEQFLEFYNLIGTGISNLMEYKATPLSLTPQEKIQNKSIINVGGIIAKNIPPISQEQFLPQHTTMLETDIPSLTPFNTPPMSSPFITPPMSQSMTPSMTPVSSFQKDYGVKSKYGHIWLTDEEKDNYLHLLDKMGLVTRNKINNSYVIDYNISCSLNFIYIAILKSDSPRSLDCLRNALLMCAELVDPTGVFGRRTTSYITFIGNTAIPCRQTFSILETLITIKYLSYLNRPNNRPNIGDISHYVKAPRKKSMLKKGYNEIYIEWEKGRQSGIPTVSGCGEDYSVRRRQLKDFQKQYKLSDPNYNNFADIKERLVFRFAINSFMLKEKYPNVDLMKTIGLVLRAKTITGVDDDTHFWLPL